MLGHVAAVLGEAAVVLPAGLPIGQTVTAIEGAIEGAGAAVVVLVLVEAELPAVERAMLLAAIGPLAVARAPGRVCALEVGAEAAVADVVAAARFLAGAGSTTGQVLRID